MLVFYAQRNPGGIQPSRYRHCEYLTHIIAHSPFLPTAQAQLSCVTAEPSPIPLQSLVAVLLVAGCPVAGYYRSLFPVSTKRNQKNQKRHCKTLPRVMAPKNTSHNKLHSKLHSTLYHFLPRSSSLALSQWESTACDSDVLHFFPTAHTP